MRREPAPASETELLVRAQRLAGCSLAEMAARHEVAVPIAPVHAKGFAGQLLELALGADAGSRPEPDFTGLGIELKSIPLRANGTPAESTYLCVATLQPEPGSRWETSLVHRKLRRVLWVPVESDTGRGIGARRIGWPVLWSPSAAQERVLRSDWEELMMLIATGQLESLDARMGQALQLRPKGANGRALVRSHGHDGAPARTLPRGFYLRPTFTHRILADAVP